MEYIDSEALFDHNYALNKICLPEASYRSTQHQGLRAFARDWQNPYR
jgi:hypothetical protein